MKRRGKELLKGIAGVGMVLGGAQAYADTELLFAYEQEQSEEQFEELEAAQSASVLQSEVTLEEASVSVKNSISEENSLIISESESAEAALESVATSLSASTDIVESELASANEDISTAEISVAIPIKTCRSVLYFVIKRYFYCRKPVP